MLKIDKAAYKKLTAKSLVAPIEKGNALSELYHENTKLGPVTGAAYYREILNVTSSPVLARMIDHPCKIYSLCDTVDLERPVAGNEIEAGILARRSERHFTGEPIPLETLSRLLYFSYGITDPKQGFRATPSGGALYPLEFYVFSRNVSGLDSGIYHYNVDRHALDALDRCDLWPRLQKDIGFQYIDVEEAAALVLITAIFRRTTLKYQDRGYRMILFEAGAAAQNLALAAGGLGVGSCLLGAFHDNDLSDLLGVNGVDEAPLIPIILGAKSRSDQVMRPQWSAE